MAASSSSLMPANSPSRRRGSLIPNRDHALARAVRRADKNHESADLRGLAFRE